MSVIGLDVGNHTCLVAQAKRGGIDVLLNDESQRQNMTAASFSGKERFISDAAGPHLLSNYKNSVVQLKRLIGRRFDDPMVARDIAEFLTFKVVPVDDGAACGIEVKYQDKTQVMSPQAIMAMVLGRMRDIANKCNPGATATDMVLSVPASFNNAQRQAMLDASRIAGLNCLKLLNEGTAIALGYGFFRAAKKPFDDSTNTRVLIVDVGHSHTTATLVAYRAKSASVVASVTDEQAGGREVDLAIAKHLAEVFAKANGGKDCWSNAKARIKLMGAAEKAKKTLSPHGVSEAHVNQEFLFDDCDLRTTVTIDQLEELVQPIAARISNVVADTIKAAELKPADLECVEIVGAAVRVRAAKRAIAEALGMPLDEASGHGLGTSMNQDEAVAKGCALQCAMLSPLFRVKEFHIADRVPCAIRLHWEADSEAAEQAAAAATEASSSSSSSSSASSSASASAGGVDDTSATDSSTSVVMFGLGDPTPVTRRITFHRRKPFTISASYTGEGIPDGAHTHIGNFTVGGFPPAVSATSSSGVEAGPAPKVRVDFEHDIHGILRIAHAVVLQEKKEDPAPAPSVAAAPAEGEAPDAPVEGGTPAAPAEGETPDASVEGETPAASAEAEASAASAEGEASAAAEGEAPAGDSETPAADANAPEAAAADAAPADAPADDGKPRKKKFRKVPLAVGPAPQPGVMVETEVRAAYDAELEMQRQDRIIQATQARRNEIEEYVYSMRSEIEGALSGFAKEEEAETLRAQLSDAEDWVCYGDGFDADLETLTARLEQLRALGEPIAQRAWEAEHRGPAAARLLEAVERFKDIVRSTDERYEHLGDEDRDRLRSATRTAEEWLRDLQDSQAARAPVEDAVLKTAEIEAKERWLSAECDPVANKPKPPPPAPAPLPAEADAPAAEPNAGEAAAAEPEGAAAKTDGEAEAASPDADAKPTDAKPEHASEAEAPADAAAPATAEPEASVEASA